jgi:hypothetical protein
MNVNSYQPYARTAQTGRTLAFKGNGAEIGDVAENLRDLVLGRGTNNSCPEIVQSLYDCGNMPCRQFAIQLNKKCCELVDGYESQHEYFNEG